MDWRPAGWSVCQPLLISPCTIKSRSSLLALAYPGSPSKRAVKRLWWWFSSGNIYAVLDWMKAEKWLCFSFLRNLLLCWHCCVVVMCISSCYLQQRVASYEPTSWECRRGSLPNPSPASPAITSPVLMPARNSFHNTTHPLNSFPWYVGLLSTRADWFKFEIIFAACSSGCIVYFSFISVMC